MICNSCKTEKLETEFNWNNKTKGIRQKFCRECKSAQQRRWYQGHKSTHYIKVKINQQRYRLRNEEFLVNYLFKHPCVDCGYTDIRALTFDHLTDKHTEICKLISGGNVSLKTLQHEISKCEVRCANCHFIKTNDRAGGFWKQKWWDGRGTIPQPST